MKKRNLGRIAALGLAGLTSIPVVAMSASATVSVAPGIGTENNLPQLSGTAYRATWYTNASTTVYTYTKNSDGIIERTASVPTNDPYAKFKEKLTINSVSCTVCDDVYYGYLDRTPGTLRTLEENVKLSEAADNKAKSDKDALMSEYNSYVNAYNKVVDAHAATPDKDVSASFTTRDKKTIYICVDKNGTWSYTYGSNKAYPYEQISDSEVMGSLSVTDYTVTKNAGTTVTMKQLYDAFGGNHVYMNNMGIIGELADFEGDLSAKEYTLNTTANSGTTNNGTTNVGDYYAVYASPSDAIEAYPTASYMDAVYYDRIGGNYWPNLASLRAYYGVTSIPSSLYTIYSRTGSDSLTNGNRYFDCDNGYYYSNSGTTSLGHARVRVNTTSNYYYTKESGVYYNSSTRLYYLSYSAAYNANSNGTITRHGDLNTTLPYFSMSTGSYYSTYTAALYASSNNSSRVITVNGGSTYYDYLDPYYYYYMAGTGLSNNNKDTSAVTIGNRKGWTNVASYARNAKSGASYNVSMNGETVVPSTVLAAIKGRNVTMNFTLKNGVVYSINGNDVSSAKDLDIDTTYNTKNIPSKLISKAKSKNNGVSTSQLSIDGGSFGSSADVTVKFATKRAGCTARLYRYNADRNTLSLVSKSSVGSNGKCTFDDVTKGGDYVIVLS